MANFTENSQWVSVTKPDNIDYNIAEKSTVFFSAAHSFIAGDYLTNPANNSAGIVYEVLSGTSLNIARDTSTVFAASGNFGNGVATVAYSSITTTHGINNDVSQRLVDRTKWLYDNKAGGNISVSAGSGLTGGGDLSANRTITLGTPSTISNVTTNSVSGTTHTHAIASSSTSVAGVVQLNDTLTSTSTTQALTAAQGKILQDNKADNTITISAGVGLTGGGNLTANRTITMGTPSTLNGNTTNSVSGTTHAHAISAATDTVRGVVELATTTETANGLDTTRVITPWALTNSSSLSNQDSLNQNLSLSQVVTYRHRNCLLSSGNVVTPISYFGRTNMVSDHLANNTWTITFPFALTRIFNIHCNAGLNQQSNFYFVYSITEIHTGGFTIRSGELAAITNPVYMIWSAFGWVV